MNVKHSLSLAFSAVLLAGSAHAQSARECPSLPPDAADDFHWSVLRTDSALLCRALSNDAEEEAFAVTVTRKSPFKPNSHLREEQGQIQGQTLWWYRSEIAGRPNELVRETLLKLDSNRMVHVFIRSDNAETLTRYQQLAQSMTFSPAIVATR